ncbi:translocation protein TolB precursor [Nitrobacter sp. Nb-311A]|nr:translocation protein TolB precursor [Nitrobacter sp. Nb-311A]
MVVGQLHRLRASFPRAQYYRLLMKPF